MSTAPLFVDWIRLVGLLFVETALFFALALFAHRWIRSARGQRLCWIAAILSILLTSAAELTGAGRGFVGLVTRDKKASATRGPAPERDRKVVVTVREPSAAILPRRSANQLVVPSAPGTWWPAVIWVAGTSIVLGRAMVGRTLLLRFRRRRNVVDDDLLQRARAIAAQLQFRRKIVFLFSKRLTSPIAFGIFNPTIVLPENFAGQFAPGQQDAMLAHELAHLASRDTFWYGVADFASALVWWNPIAWRVRRHFQAACEAAADEASVLLQNGPEHLADCLVTLASRWRAQQPCGALSVEGSGFRSGLGKRVQHLLKLQSSSVALRTTPSQWTAAIIISLLAAALVSTTRSWADTSRDQTDFTEAWKQSLAGLAVQSLVAKHEPAVVVAAAQPTDSLPPTSDSKGTAATNEFPTHVFRIAAPLLIEELKASGFYADEPVPAHTKAQNVFITQDSGRRVHRATSTTELHKAFRNYLLTFGIDLSGKGKSVFYNDRTGILMVRASSDDLALVAQVAERINVHPQQLVIDMKVVEVPGSGNLADDVEAFVPGPLSTFKNVWPDQVVTTGSMALLTETQLRAVTGALEKARGASILATPRITTLSGRQAQIKVVSTMNIVTSFDTAVSGPVKPITTAVEVGPIVDVVPFVGADGSTIEMTVVGSVKEFLGYERNSSKPTDEDPPLPRLRVQQVLHKVTVQDGSTIMLTMDTGEAVLKPKSSIRAGDVPLFDEFYRTESSVPGKRVLLFITPRLIDAAGNALRPAR
jgi:beta-lactamase regulating signal transducer with metallopeptidase domain